MMIWIVLSSASLAGTCPTPEAISARLTDSACPTLELMSLQHGADEACMESGFAPLGLGRVTAVSRDTPPPPGGKQLRDAYGLANTRESANFALRWGSTHNLSDSKADYILETFETAWEEILIDLDYVAPQGSGSYKFNLYMGGTGGPREGGAAYYSGDSQGYPMIVITRGTYDDEGYGKTVGAHEFFHALQGAAGSRYEYYDGSPGAWYWEATANWVETEIYPENRAQYVSGFLGGFALYPHFSVNFFDYPDSGSLQEYYQYGAFIFPYYLTREVADASVIRSSWLDSNLSDPLSSLRSILSSEWSVDLDEAYFDFAARNATYRRYDDGDIFSSYVDYYEDYYGNYGDRTIGTAGPEEDWTDAPSGTLPRTYGSNYLRIDAGSEDVVVGFRGAGEGSRGSTPTWDVRAIIVDGNTESEVPVPLTDHRGEATVPGSAGADEVWLSVTVISGDNDYNETFAWSYSIGADVGDDTEDPGDDTGSVVDDTADPVDGGGGDKDGRSGCSALGGAAGWGLVLWAVAAVGLRRRA